MTPLDLKPLFGRLNPHCRQALESAAGIALSRGHQEIGIEHLLHALLAEPRSDLPLLLTRLEADALRLLALLERQLSAGEPAHQGRPMFAPGLIDCVRDAWLIASINLGRAQIRGGALLLALTDRGARYTLDAPWADCLAQLPRQRIVENFDALTEGSIEQAHELSSGSGTPGTAAGDATGKPAVDGALASFCENFTAKAAQGGLDPVFGRGNEIRQIIDILSRRRKNNPICVGEPGVGKTAVVEGLALRIVAGEVPSFLRDTRLLGLDLGLLEAGASVKGEFERRLRSVIDEVKASPVPTILFIDEAHMLVGAGGAAGAGGVAANLLKPALARGELRTIAATTWAEYKKYFEKDAALARRFQAVRLGEPDVPTALTILRGLKPRYEAAHGVTVRDDALLAAVELSRRYIAARQLPDKAVDLLDTAAARVRIGLDAKPAALEALEQRLAALQRERTSLARDVAHGHSTATGRLDAIEAEQAATDAERASLHARWQQALDSARARIAARAGDASPQPATDTNVDAGVGAAADDVKAATAVTPGSAETGIAPLVFTEVSPESIAQVVSDWTGVPLGHLQQARSSTFLSLASELKQRVRGQDEALDNIASTLRSASSGLTDPHQPHGVFLLAGPSGVGKTETALAIAEQLFGGEQALVTINMSEFQEKHTASRLVGAPPGYVGYGEGGVLTEAIRQRPYSAILLDEVEKAHLDVVNLFHQVFDKGVLADGEGRVIDFSNTVIFLTTNLGSAEIEAACANAPATLETLAAHIAPGLTRHFKTALLARMTVVPYRPLDHAAMCEIARQKVAALVERIARAHGIALHVSEAAIAAIGARCTQSAAGARHVNFLLRKELMPALSDTVLRALAAGQRLTRITLDLAESSTARHDGWRIEAFDADGPATLHTESSQ
ncbi:MAG: type VI secretion system ATPase TssH [Janthinobacterium lividum]